MLTDGNSNDWLYLTSSFLLYRRTIRKNTPNRLKYDKIKKRRSAIILLKQNMTQLIQQLTENETTEIALHKIEKDYAEKHGLIPSPIKVVEKENRFDQAYVERCEKETIALVIVETPKFLDEQIDHLKTHSKEFLYVEDTSFDLVGIDALSMEVDDVFGMYTALFGLKMKKQYDAAIKDYLDTHLKNDTGKFSVSFSGQDGLWNMNLAVNCIDGFHADMTLLAAYELVYTFVFQMIETIEETK